MPYGSGEIVDVTVSVVLYGLIVVVAAGVGSTCSVSVSVSVATYSVVVVAGSGDSVVYHVVVSVVEEVTVTAGYTKNLSATTFEGPSQ